MLELSALFLFAFSPNIIAHSRLSATDVPLAAFIFISFYYLYLYLENTTDEDADGGRESRMYGVGHKANSLEHNLAYIEFFVNLELYFSLSSRLPYTFNIYRGYLL